MPLLRESGHKNGGNIVGIKRDIEYAIYNHGAWKARFRDFLNGRVSMDLAVVGQTHACKLGQWLENEARRMLSPEDHAEACRLHEQFHQVAGEIVHRVKQKDFAAARQALVPAGSFDQASHELAAFLRKMPMRQRAGAEAAPPPVHAEESKAVLTV